MKEVWNAFQSRLYSRALVLFFLSIAPFSACQKLGYKPSEVPVEFSGIKSVYETRSGTYVVNWDRPENESQLVDSYEIYISDVSSSSNAKLAEDAPTESVSSGSETGGLIVYMSEPETPAVKGRVIATVRGENTYTITGLTSGNYGIQVKAVGKNGTRDVNRKVVVLSVVLQVQFAGVEKAEYDGNTTNLKLSWKPFVTKVKGEPIYYVVFEGDTFNDSDRIAVVKTDATTGELPNFYNVSLKAKIPGSTVTYGVRVKDPLGRMDNNTRTVSYLIPTAPAEDVCLSADAVSSVKIRVTFKFPQDAEKINIRRNGFLITSITDKSATKFDDFPLTQGTNYQYSCELIRYGNSFPGRSVFSAVTRSSDPPTFNGIKTATYDPGAKKVSVTWDDGTNVPVSYYNVFASPGPVIQWSKGFEKQVDEATVKTDLEALGDEFTYSIGVRACSIANFCDDNTKMVQVTMPDSGPPKSVGVTAVDVVTTGSAGPKLVITAPWRHSDGYIRTRYVYFHRAPVGAPASASDLNDLSKYTRVAFDVPDSDKWSPKTTLELAKPLVDNIAENSIYNIIVQDSDGKPGGQSANKNRITVTTPDFSAPSFDDGVTSLEIGPKAYGVSGVDLRDKALIARFKAPPESEEVSHYQVYLQEVSGAANAVCPAPSLTVDRSNLAQGSLYGELSVKDLSEDDSKLVRFIRASDSAVSLHTPGADAAILITGLKERTDYIVCLRARDANGNISGTTVAKRKNTIDVTPPVFDGVQSLSYVKEQQAVKVVWNPSLSSDTLSYLVQVWVFDRSTSPSLTPVTNPQDAKVFEAPHPLGSLTLTNDAVDLGSNYNVFVVVNACDSGGKIPGGQQNCKEFDLSTFKKLELADILPPPGCRRSDPGCVPFAGILNASQLEQTQLSPNEISIKVKWASPQVALPQGQTEIDAAWADFKGFKVYSVGDGESLTLLKDCPAKVGNQYMTSCDVGGFDPFRDYRLHVRAYDGASPPNETVNLSTIMQSASIRTIDITPPTFIPNLKTAYDPGIIGVNVSWSKASDNQYVDNPDSIIKYEVYRKKNSDIIYDTDRDPNKQNPSLDTGVVKIGVVTELTFADTNSIEGGTSYYYTVCAVDGSSNRRCSGSSKKQDIDDTTPPVINDLRIVDVGATVDSAKNSLIQKAVDAKSWDLVWTVSDNKDSPANLFTWVCIEITEIADGPKDVDKDCSPALGQGYDLTRIANIGGPADRDVYVNYRLFVQDLAGLVSSRTISVRSTNKLSLTGIKSSEGSLDGGQLLVVNGSGFHSSAKIMIGDQECTSLQVVASDRAICKIPASTAPIQASVSLSVSSVNEIGVMKTSSSSSSATVTYNYCNAAQCKNICNDPSRWSTSSAPFAAGTGSSDAPWIICTPQQLDAIRTKGSIQVGGNSGPPNFKLAANLDLSSYTNNSFKPISTTSRVGRNAYFVVDGDGYVVANYTYKNITEDYVGLFGYFWAGEGYVTNIGAINVDVQGKSFVGGLFARSDYFAKVFNNVFVTGKISAASHYVGGITGYSQSVLKNASANVSVASTDGLYVGGLVGKQVGAATGSLSASGTVQTGCSPNFDSNWKRNTYGDCYIGGLIGQYEGKGELVGPTFTGTVKANWNPNDSSETSRTCKTAIQNGRTRYFYCQAYRTGGLIGLVASGGAETKITNAVVNADVIGDYDVGGVIGGTSWHGSVIIDNASFNGTVTGREQVGGILGRSEPNWEAGLRTAFTTTGGGPLNITIKNSKVDGAVTQRSNWKGDFGDSTSAPNATVGGIIGQLDGHCGTYYTAGSDPTGLIMDSYSTASVSGQGNNVGGAVGQLFCAKMSGVKAYGDVTNTSGASFSTGGSIGWMRHAIVDNSQAYGSVTSGGVYVGGFFGYTEWGWGMISNSSARGNVRGGEQVGGFGGHTWLGWKEAKPSTPSKVINCSASGDVTATSSGWINTGGFIGAIKSGVRWNGDGAIPQTQRDAMCVNTETSGNGCSVWAQYENNRATGKVTATAGRNVGGFVGYIESSYVERAGWGVVRDGLQFSKNSATGDVSSIAYAGGFVGIIGDFAAKLSIMQNFATGNVAVSTNYAGGFVGWHNPGQRNGVNVPFDSVVISDNYARGNVSADVGNVGGFGAAIHQIYQKSYSTGKVTGSTNGGFSALYGASSSGGLSGMPSTYFDKTAAGVSTSPYSVGKSTPDMQIQSTFVGFDFDTIWKIPDGGGYPVFKWQ